MKKDISKEEYKQMMYDRWNDEVSHGVVISDLTKSNQIVKKILEEIKNK